METVKSDAPLRGRRGHGRCVPVRRPDCRSRRDQLTVLTPISRCRWPDHVSEMAHSRRRDVSREHPRQSLRSRPVPPAAGDAFQYKPSDATIRYIITKDLTLNTLTFDPSRWAARIVEVSTMLDANSVDLSQFMGKGGKLILLVGSIDDSISSYNTLNYYGRLVSRFGQGRARFFRRASITSPDSDTGTACSMRSSIRWARSTGGSIRGRRPTRSSPSMPIRTAPVAHVLYACTRRGRGTRVRATSTWRRASAALRRRRREGGFDEVSALGIGAAQALAAGAPKEKANG